MVCFGVRVLGGLSSGKVSENEEYWGGPISYEEYVSRMIQVILCGKKMYDYFKLHPEFGMEFPEATPWPYE